MRPSGTITFIGIGGRIDGTQQGDFEVFGTVAYDECATFNVISVDSLPKSSVVTYDHAAIPSSSMGKYLTSRARMARKDYQ